MKEWLLAILCTLALASAWAREAAPLAADEAVEKRLVAISEELRCLVCQNESLAASRADLAVDLRRQIREQIREGRSDREIMDYMVARYGDFVRYRPPLKGTTLLLWFGPALLLVAGMTTLVLYLRRRGSRVHDATLSAEEQARADALLSQGATDTEKQS
ncbi:MAG: cytochrome c-type biogenesis protein [Pseudomonadota bacterium]|jgi:cytochrome c-type biogenesis protein CcmH